MSDRLIDWGVTVKDIVLLFGACMVATVVVYYLMVYLVGFAIQASLELPIESSNGLECIANCKDYEEALKTL